MNKKILIITLFLLFSMAMAFCVPTTAKDQKSTWSKETQQRLSLGTLKNGIDFFNGILSFYMQIIVGVAGGALMALRFTIEVVHTLIMTEASNSPGELRKVITRFFLHMMIAMFGVMGVLAILGYTTGGTSIGGSSGNTSGTRKSLAPVVSMSAPKNLTTISLTDGSFLGNVDKDDSKALTAGSFLGNVNKDNGLADGVFYGNIDKENGLTDSSFLGNVDKDDSKALTAGSFLGNVNKDNGLTDGSFLGNVDKDDNKALTAGSFLGNVNKDNGLADGVFYGNIDKENGFTSVLVPSVP